MSLLAALLASGCGGRAEPPPSPLKWTTAFWFRLDSPASISGAGTTVDAIFFEVGSVHRQSVPITHNPWFVNSYFPERLPPAHEYWLVYRCPDGGSPALEALPELQESVAHAVKRARERGLNVVGIQIDADSAARSLADYARFLKGLRGIIPAGLQISITASLDWFRGGTAIAGVLAEADEFVPRFFAVQEPNGYRRGRAVAEPVEAGKWRRKLNEYRKKFRIGIASFGGSRVSRPSEPPEFYSWAMEGVRPLDLGTNPSFKTGTAGTKAGETVVSYQATKKVRIDYLRMNAGDTLEFTLPSEDSVRAAVNAAKEIGGFCAGVVFFRWPTADDAVSMQPDEVLRAAGVLPAPETTAPCLSVSDRHCAAVHCVDLHLTVPLPLSSKPLRYRLRSSAPLEYAIPADGVPLRMSGPAEMELLLPPYSSRPRRMRLGAAVTLQPSEYTVEEAR